MIFDILTIFPEFFRGPFEHGVVARAREGGLLDIRTHDLRNWTSDRHRTVDDRPFGGGEGMLLKPEPLFLAVEAIWPERGPDRKVVLLSAQGRLFDQEMYPADRGPLRGRGRAGGGAPGRRRGFDRRFRSERRRIGCGGDCGCSRAAAAGRPRQREFGAERIVQRGG